MNKQVELVEMALNNMSNMASEWDLNKDLNDKWDKLESQLWEFFGDVYGCYKDYKEGD